MSPTKQVPSGSKTKSDPRPPSPKPSTSKNVAGSSKDKDENKKSKGAPSSDYLLEQRKLQAESKLRRERLASLIWPNDSDFLRHKRLACRNDDKPAEAHMVIIQNNKKWEKFYLMLTNAHLN